MKKVVHAHWSIWGGLLFSLACLAGEVSGADPAQGIQVAVGQSVPRAEPGATLAKTEKVNGNLSQGAKAYQEGRFADAAAFYESALQLDPQNPAIRQQRDNALAMREAQVKAGEQLPSPSEPKARAKAIESIYDQARDQFKQGDFKQAEAAFHKLSLVADGSLRVKALSYYEKCREENTKVAAATVAKAEGKSEALPNPAPVAAAPLVQVTAAAVPPAPAPAPAIAPAPEVAPPPAVMAPVIDDITRLQVNRLIHDTEGLIAEGNYNDALLTIHKALDMWPDNSRAKELQAQINQHLRVNRTDVISVYINEGNQMVEDKQFDQAIERYREVLKLDPENKMAVQLIEKTERAKKSYEKLTTTKEKLDVKHELDGLHARALAAYEAGELMKARELWQKMLEMEPGNKTAQTYLEQTAAKWTQVQADQEALAKAEASSEKAKKLLESPITISTERKTPLLEFMRLLSFATETELQYTIVDGADTQVFVDFVDMPLREVLDKVLKPVGLTWAIDGNNVITIQRNMISKTYTLTAPQMTTIRSMLDSQELQMNIWGQAEPPAKGSSITLDERQNLLLVTGSERDIQRIESFLPSISNVEAPGLEFRMYKIREEDGPRIKSLVDSIIQASPETPFDLERKIIVDGADLIIRDTLENITKIEELLIDKNFIEGLRNEEVGLENFSLAPRNLETAKSDLVRAFTSRVIEAIKVFLYAKEGESEAEAQGRRMWFDESTLQLTIVDTPFNLQRVAEYLESLPELAEEQRQKVLFLKYAVASELSSSLESILGIAGAGGAFGDAAEETVVKLRRGDVREFAGARIRVIRVEQNDEEDRNDDSVELSLTTTSGTNNVTLQELETQTTDDYELTAEDVTPSSGLPGEGSARIRVRFIPTLTESGGLGQPFGAQALVPTAVAPPLEEDLTINAVEELNALIVRYQDVGKFKDVLDLVEQLDKPVKQVAIQTKFVEVNETRAKEFSADFNIAGLGQGRDIDWGSQLINTRFAQDMDEFRDIFSPPIENPANANLIKNTTVIDAVIGSFPNIQYSLRLLEAEGIINVINGPQVTSLNGKEAEFRIERYTGTGGGGGGGTGGQDLFSPLDSLSIEIADQDEATESDLISAVVLRVTPEITSENSIILRDLSAELVDFESWLGEIVVPVVEGEDNEDLVASTYAMSNPNARMLLKRKKVITDARITDGGTIIIGGWTSERSQELTSGVPVLRNMPYFGKLLFSRAQRTRDRTTLLIFLTGNLVE